MNYSHEKVNYLVSYFIMSKSWKDFELRLAKGETVEEIIDFKNEVPKPIINKCLQIDVGINEKNFALKPMISKLNDLIFQKEDDKLIIPHPSIRVHESFPM